MRTALLAGHRHCGPTGVGAKHELGVTAYNAVEVWQSPYRPAELAVPGLAAPVAG